MITKKLRSMADLMAGTVPTTAEAPAKRAKAKPASPTVQQQQLVVQLPAETIKALKVAALDADTTVRAVLLQALEVAGYPVPAGQTVDFRKVRA